VRSPLSVRDFAGTWCITSNTVGGLSGNTGASSATIGQATFDRRGKGTGSFKGARYSGPIGTALVDASASGLTFAISAVDPKTGYARIEATDTALGVITTTLDVVVTRATSGKVVRMNGVDVATAGLVVPVSGVFATTFTRQNL
jgi:K+-transporting ATPase c subunit